MANIYEPRVIADIAIRRFPELRESAEYTKTKEEIEAFIGWCGDTIRKEWLKLYMYDARMRDQEAAKTITDPARKDEARFAAAVQYVAAFDLLDGLADFVIE